MHGRICDVYIHIWKKTVVTILAQYNGTIDGFTDQRRTKYTVRPKKYYLAKCNYWRPLKSIFNIPYYLLHLHRILGYVYVLQDTIWCPYIVAYSLAIL